ncbi:MAG TPA: tRNA (adenosine(37)-N6)-dimethylallyltransferase MiaA [Candidatus Cloacimonadota bacterium]|nr:tRNA (adenosine(37)-N6)-dimethylallyltransferase MiaA [Candidatus Cloacimonadota bacterium]
MIITVEGPTGAGKSAIALELAQALQTEIISCDSRQVYRYLDIGTAKVDYSARELVKHHLLDIVDPNQSYNAGNFVKDATAVIKQLQEKGKTPILCGGTGMYIKSLLEGLFEHPPLDPAIRKKLKLRLQNEGLAALYAELCFIDPPFSLRIGPNDPQRTLRGMEIYLATGKSITQHWAEQHKSKAFDAFRILIAPPRDVLYQRINARMTQMLERGLLSEIKMLLEMDFTWHDPGLNSLGYKEFRAHFEDHGSAEECAALAAQHHRNYAKRQMTWYRKVTFDLTCDNPRISLSDVLRALKAR